MKMKKWISVFALLFAAIGFYCLSAQGTQTEQKHVVLIVKSMDHSNDFWTFVMKGADMAAKEYGVKLTILGAETELEYELQGKMIEDAIALDPDAIVLSPTHPEKTIPYARKVEEAGIEMIMVDSVMDEPMGTCTVATDNVDAGRKMGTYILENFPKDTCIGVVSHMKGVSTAVLREQGLREGLEDMEANIAEIVFCDSDTQKAYLVTQQMLEAHPEINVIVSLNEHSSVGAARAVIAMGLEEQIQMIGFDSSLEEVEYLEGGIFEAIVVQKPLNMGYLAIENTIKVLQNKEVDEMIDSGSVLVTKETIYTPENQKLLFPL